MERLSERALSCWQECDTLAVDILKPFTQVNLVDSTIIKLPLCLAHHFQGVGTTGSEAAMKVQLSYEYLSGRMNAIHLEAGRSPDQKSDLPLQFAQAGSLTLMDLGYFDQKTFASIAENSAYFISRLQSQVGLYQIELIFKLWKSQAKIKVIAAWRLERVLCQFYPRFLGVILLHWLSAKQRVSLWLELNLPKAYGVLRRQATRLLDAIADTWFTVASILDKIIKDFRRFALKNKRQKSLSTYQLLVLADA